MSSSASDDPSHHKGKLNILCRDLECVRPYGIVVVRNRKCNLIEYSREVEGVYNVEVENSDQGEGCAL